MIYQIAKDLRVKKEGGGVNLEKHQNSITSGALKDSPGKNHSGQT